MFIFREFTHDLPRDRFDCGNSAMDQWFREQAGQQERRGSARTTLGLDEKEARIASYFTLVTHRLELDELAGTSLGLKRRYPMPAMLIARLAVDREYHGTGLGRITLITALDRLATASASIGFEVVVVDAIDHNAARFYEHHGFTRLDEQGRRLFMRVATLREGFASAIPPSM